MALRWYQQQAVMACWDYLRNKQGAPVLVLPTGSGKTHVIAALCQQVVQWGGRVVVLAHVKELLQQAADKLSAYLPADNIGVYSAGLNSRETDKRVIIAGSPSNYTRANELGSIQLVIVDEAHMIPPEGNGRYRTFLNDLQQINTQARLVGLTATPYRLGSGWIVRDRVDFDDNKDRLFESIAYEAPLYKLISDGTLSQVISQSAKHKPDFSGVHTTRGDFDEKEIEAIWNGRGVLESATFEIIDKAKERNKVLIFCNRVESARRVAKILTEQDKEHAAAVVDGETSANDRADVVRRFKSDDGDVDLFGNSNLPLKYVCNVGVFTTGFDAPNVDCVALLRPTKSLTLYQQMVGRGLRKAENKSNCLILDFGGNIDRLGPIDTAIPQYYGKSDKPKKSWKECGECGSFNALNARVCCVCGNEFPIRSYDPDKNITSGSSNSGILSSQVKEPEPIVEEFNLIEFTVEEHHKRDAEPGTPPTLQCNYKVIGPYWPRREWLCPEHGGRIRRKFEQWWRDKSNAPPPETVAQAVALIKAGFTAKPLKIRTVTKPRSKFPEIEWIEKTEIPAYNETAVTAILDAQDQEDDSWGDFAEFEEQEPQPQVIDAVIPERCKTCANFSPNDTGSGFYCREWGTQGAPDGVAPSYSCYQEPYDEGDMPF